MANVQCPVPRGQYSHLIMGHGGGGRLMQQLIENLFLPAFRSEALNERHDGAVLHFPPGRLAFTTDSYVVRPLFFPGGDIGSLAINGTVNDLAMCGARPLFLSVGLIAEEGLPIDTLHRVIESMQRSALLANVTIVTGDTKVVDRGKGDGLYVNTSGVGVVEHALTIAPRSVQPGDAIILSGDIGRHGMAVMSVREGLAFETPVLSDCAPLAESVLALLRAGVEIHCLRDLTRGGLAAGLVEIAEAARVRIQIHEPKIPVADEVRGVCEVLGLDPLHVANEGRFVVFIPVEFVERVMSILQQHPCSANAVVIGEVTAGKAGLVSMKTRLGTNRVIDLPSGEQLPRIC